MKNVAISVLIVLLASGAYASGLGTNITIYDGLSQGSTGWNGMQEDQEVEPGNTANQSWDLEGFFLDGNSLNMAGGYDFVDGNGHPDFMSGDIFIDVNGDATYGQDILPRNHNHPNGYKTVNNIDYGYDYVLDLNFEHMTFRVVDLSGNDSWISVYDGDNDESNPYRYDHGGTVVGQGTIGYQTGLTDAQTSLLGDSTGSHDGGDDGHDGHDGGDCGPNGSHNVATFDLFDNTGWDLDPYLEDGILFHFTMGNGADNLMGYLPGATQPGPDPVPEPASMALMGLGIGGLWVRARRARTV